jgi:hypothetical protein
MVLETSRGRIERLGIVEAPSGVEPPITALQAVPFVA